jgi:hypothetical protein
MAEGRSTSDIKDTSRISKGIEAVRERIRRNPISKQKIMAREMKISPRSMSRIIKEDLKFEAYRRRTGQLLTTVLRLKRTMRTKKLLQRHTDEGHRKILFTDEKMFTIEEKFNRPSDEVYAHRSKEATEIPEVERGHHSASVMV